MPTRSAHCFAELATHRGDGITLEDEHGVRWWKPADATGFGDLVERGLATMHADVIGFDHADFARGERIETFGLTERGSLLASELYPVCTQCTHGFHDGEVCGMLDVSRLDDATRTVPICYCGQVGTEAMPAAELTGTLHF